MKNPLRLFLVALALAAAAGVAVPWAVAEWRYRALLADRALVAGERDPALKPERTCPDPESALVLVTFGQSNAANHGASRLASPAGTFDFFEGRCFAGDDPQYGATGFGGSPWPALARSLRARGETRPILIASIGVGNTKAGQWIPLAEHGRKLERIVADLTRQGYAVDAYLFFQGEADRETSPEAYLDALLRIAEGVRARSPAAPLILSDSSICGAEGATRVASLSAARREAARREGVVLGPDTDALGPRYRSDGCHFNAEGLERLGVLWAQSLAEALE